MMRILHLFNLLFFLVLLTIASIDPTLLSHSIFHDDSFYYFKIAENYLSGNGFSFNGLSQTTGFHPLWMYLLVLASGLLGIFFTSVHIIYVSIFLSFLMAIIFIHINKKICDRLFGNEFSVFASAIILLFCYRFIYDGMESGLVLILISMGLAGALFRDIISIGLSLALLVWARIDLFQLLIPCVALAGAYLHFREKRKFLGLDIVKNNALIVAVVVISVMLRSFLHPNQISSEVKKFWFELSVNGSSFLELLILTVKRLVAGSAQVWWPFDITTGWFLNSNNTLPITLAVLLGGATISIFLFAVVRIILANEFDRGPYLVSVMSLAAVCYIAVHSFFGTMSPNWQWYLAFPTFAFVYLCILTFRTILFEKNKKSFLAGCIAIVLLLNLTNYTYLFINVRDNQWRVVYNSMVSELSQNVSLQSVVGTWAAGHVGYFARQKIVNLEGLVEGDLVLKASRNDDIRRVIDAYGIDYILIKKSPGKILEEVQLAEMGEPMSRHNLRSRVFKDLTWEVVSHVILEGGTEFSLLEIQSKISVDN